MLRDTEPVTVSPGKKLFIFKTLISKIIIYIFLKIYFTLFIDK